MCDTVILIPLSFCAFNVSCLFNGLVYYNQWDRLRWWQLLCVMLGVVITICGVICLSWRRGSGITQEETVVAREDYTILNDNDSEEQDQLQEHDPIEQDPSNETSPLFSRVHHRRKQYNSA